MTEQNDLLDDLSYEDESKLDTPQNREIEKTVPKKYEGKTVEDLIEMHVNVEKVMQRQGNELGQLRTHVDRLLVSTKEKPEPKAPITSTDLFSDPQKALEGAIESSPLAERLDKLEQDSKDREVRRGQKEFESKFPDFKTDADTPEFRDWVLKNKARTALLVNLHQNYDFDAGEALGDMWDEYKQVTVGQDNPAKAKTPKARVSSTVRQSATDSTKGKPVFSRVKLAKLQEAAERGDPAAALKWNDPDFQRQYYEAYAEKRVR